MKHYILDYSDPNDPGRRSGHDIQPRKRMFRVFGRVISLVGGLLYGIGLIFLIRQRTEIHTIRQQYDSQAIQYDSLLAAKLETDQRLAALYHRIATEKRGHLVSDCP